ncbi:MAG: 4-(cytidine 5'-diphospho)-2-C-methyl-D-erythritol kinase [Paludibacteraceae bacterium]|nr:4-(cytidine 5'-diphospho)-2-C-methyl-D-erythritol kinase [Paludibacteraceae bacterium]
MTVYPNAKINLGLSIVGKRPDGYHNLETVFLPVPGLHDVLEIEEAQGAEGLPYSFEQAGLAVDCAAEDNLIVRAYLRVREAFPRVGDVRIRFRKQIPFGAGLGGGSADAAFTVKALNELFRLGMSAREMEELVSPLGADCAFFIQNRPRYAEGIGDVFYEVPEAFVKQLKDKWLLLVKPNCAVSTKVAYQGICPKKTEVPLTERLSAPLDTWQESVVNDFEESVFPQFPKIAAVKARLLDMGALYAAMSGSGATVYGIFNKRIDYNEKDCFTCNSRLFDDAESVGGAC